MTIIRIIETGMTAAIQAASKIIMQGGVIAFPTETFYGLGVKYDDRPALEKLYAMKHRSADKALPLIIGDKKGLERIVSSLTGPAEKLAEKFWPGPLTIILRARPDISELITAGTGMIAVRIPGKSFALELVRSLGFPITATSANIAGRPAADNADDVAGYFGDMLDLIIDSGKTPGGRPSTIVDASGGEVRIVRAGVISPEELFAAL